MVRRVASVLCALMIGLAPATLWPSGSLADGDPASDVLLAQNVFYPLQPPTPAAVRRALNRVTNRAHEARLPIRVALINQPTDLGAIPLLYGKPQAYAAFLEKEISYQGPQPLLIVMYNGYGVEGVNGRATTVAASLPVPAGRKGNNVAALARAAAAAIPKLAAADGHPLASGPRVSATNGAPGGIDRRVLLGILVLAAVIVAGLLLLLRLRQSLRMKAP